MSLDDRSRRGVAARRIPPVDAEYVIATQILTLCRRAVVLNRPEGILAANEKLYTLHFAELMPETLVTPARIPELFGFMAKLGGEMIVKPLDGKGGEGIFHLRTRRPESLSRSSSNRPASSPVASWRSATCPRCEQGDKRILLLDGEPIGAVLRVPGASESSARISTSVAAPIGPNSTRAIASIVEAIAPSLRRDGLFFVGIDVIGGFLTEVNVTSPTGVQEIDSLENRCLEAEILDAAEARARGDRLKAREFGASGIAPTEAPDSHIPTGNCPKPLTPPIVRSDDSPTVWWQAPLPTNRPRRLA